ncbi:MAG: Dihydropteroate synthase [Turneriella sp.]|nr:Dihydropteroate synthase [Turneriella sp.]
MLSGGASVIDVGAESTRPGATPVLPEDQLEILTKFLQAFVDKMGKEALKKISIDTRSLYVMQKTAALGITTFNDVSGGDYETYRFIADAGATYVLMHTKGTPQTMQINPSYSDVVREVENYLLKKTQSLKERGVSPERIIWDTGIGFGKTVEHNLRLIAAHPHLRKHGYPLLAGVSRKSFIGKILDGREAEDRLFATLGVQTYLTLRGCDILRVHDVKEMADILRILSHLVQYEF